MTHTYEKLLETVLRENQITLFNLDGSERELNLERHVDRYAEMCAKEGSSEWKSVVIQLTVDLWASWEIHIRKSQYKREYLGCVHIEKRWIDGTDGGPPCVLLKNEVFDEANENLAEFPVNFEWKVKNFLGTVVCRSFELEGVGTCYRLFLES